MNTARRDRGLIPALLCLGLLAPALAGARTIVVRADRSGEFGDIQEAISEARKGDVIQLAPGVYRGAGNTNLDFLGLKITLRGNPAQPGSRVIDCTGSGPGDNGIRRAIYMQAAEGRETVVEGITFRNGHAPGDDPSESVGAAVRCRGTSPVFRDCVFLDGRAYSGGAVSLERSNAEFVRCRFEGNSAEIGGAIMIAAGAPVFKECRFAGNTAARGGAIYGMLTEMVVTASTFDTNTASMGGGIACEERSRLLLDRSVLTGNFAAYGGGVEVASSVLEMNHCTLALNSGGSGGAVLLRSESRAVIAHSILALSPRGQGIAGVMEAELEVRCTLIWGNADGDWTQTAAALAEQNDNRNEDPRFVDAARGNFTLRPESPGRDPGCEVMGALP